MLSFGSIVKIPASNREGIISGFLTINNTSTILVYPVSSSVFLASNQDFLCKTELSNSFIMIETWNPVLLLMTNKELMLVDTISKDHIELYEKFLYTVLLNTEFEEKKLFTGPPIISKTDIRLFFHMQERKSFELLLRPFKKLIHLISPVSM